VIWVRTLARFLASEGRTVFLSSHLMSEMAQTADHIIVLGRGKVIADSPVADIIALSTGTAVRVRTPDSVRFAELINAQGATATSTERDLLVVNGITAANLGELASVSGVVLHELTPSSGSLEDAYLSLTQDDVEYHAGGVAATSTTSAPTSEGAIR
jgi:ABC-2 type transport system ATP-binding protein